MRAYERFIKYVQIDTTPDPNNAATQPSTQRQFDLANLLVAELKDLGVANALVDDQCYVYASIPASAGCENLPALGLVAHMDTAPDAPGANVKPILHEDYNGEDVHLPTGHIILRSVFPELEKMKGQTLITASGDTLLGGDDKAGVAEIMTACEAVLKGNLAHPKICIAFTPDEEIGAGANGFDVPGFGAAYAYTVDGGEVGEIEYESFNAAGAELTFKGVSVHPGSAKDIMVNAIKVAMEFNELLPAGECPEKTEDREGFYHLMNFTGTIEEAKLSYIIRDHDREKFEARKALVKAAAEKIAAKYGADSVQLTMEDNYYNMGEVITQHYFLVENARTAIRKAGIEPITNPVRGGTDGSRLSFMGLPCPNLGTGTFYGHGPNECISVESMDKAVEIVLNIIEEFAKDVK